MRAPSSPSNCGITLFWKRILKSKTLTVKKHSKKPLSIVSNWLNSEHKQMFLFRKSFFFFFFLRKSWKLICFHRHHTVYTAWGVSDFLWKTDPAIIDQTSSAERGAMERGHQQGLRGVESDLCENSLVCGWVCVLFYNVCATELKVKPNSAAT